MKKKEKTKMINLICASGANIGHMKNLVSKKYVSKRKMREALAFQKRLLTEFQEILDREMEH